MWYLLKQHIEQRIFFRILVGHYIKNNIGYSKKQNTILQ